MRQIHCVYRDFTLIIFALVVSKRDIVHSCRILRKHVLVRNSDVFSVHINRRTIIIILRLCVQTRQLQIRKPGIVL